MEETDIGPNESPEKAYHFAHIIQGHYHQGADLFHPNSRGKQCMTNALLSLVYSYVSNVNNWMAEDLNKILVSGDSFYTQTPKSQDFLLVSEIPKYFTCFDKNFKITDKTSMVGLVNAVTAEAPYSVLADSLQSLDASNPYALICLGCYASAVFLNNGQYFLFDSHARNDHGLPASNGTAVLLAFNSVVDLTQYVKVLSLKLGANIFEMTPIEIKTITHKALQLGFKRQGTYPHIDFGCDEQTVTTRTLMNNYMINQLQCQALNKKQRECQQSRQPDRTKYMQQYKQRQRTDTEYQHKERIQQQRTMQTARQQPELASKERIQQQHSKQTARQQPEFASKERIQHQHTMQTARQQPEFASKERIQQQRSKKRLDGNLNCI
ncbi:PREDICTED: uncharacterized protein LOC106819228 [Priapulus caudatus]|uniref:Uncharacterized protein LOC106819228 n=1 Tax=Priapulus caudatus TaxID=37621 RepID=A0ABM1F4J2_PRICU|nr:PREDICTED: uncharacterized protein LOC106819228 [Priapulus caudatus]